MDYYLVLGVAEDADEETIRSAFRLLARRYHPDVGPGSSPVEFQRAREAYETLADPERRRCYDRQRRASRPHRIVAGAFTELIVVRRPEPLFGPPRTSRGFRGSWLTRPSSDVDDVVDELVAPFPAYWFWLQRRR